MDSTILIDILALADALLAAGRCRGDYETYGMDPQSPPVAYCLVGAIQASIYEVGAERDLPYESLGAVESQIHRIVKGCVPTHRGMVWYNDDPATTDHDIRALLGAAAQRIGKEADHDH